VSTGLRMCAGLRRSSRAQHSRSVPGELVVVRSCQDCRSSMPAQSRQVFGELLPPKSGKEATAQSGWADGERRRQPRAVAAPPADTASILSRVCLGNLTAPRPLRRKWRESLPTSMFAVVCFQSGSPLGRHTVVLTPRFQAAVRPFSLVEGTLSLRRTAWAPARIDNSRLTGQSFLIFRVS